MTKIHIGDEFDVYIESVGSDGCGIARKNGFVFFVQGGIPQDEVTVRVTTCKKNCAFSEVIRFITASPLSTYAPKCTHAASTNGTIPLYRLHYEAQLREKTAIIRNALLRIGKINLTDHCFLPIIGMEYPHRYRNKARYVCWIDRNSTFFTGSYTPHSKTPIPHIDLPIYDAYNAHIIQAIRTWTVQYRQNRVEITDAVRELIIRNSQNGSMLIIFLGNKYWNRLAECAVLLKERFPCISGIMWQHIKKATVKQLYGTDFLTEQLLGLRFRMYAGTFFQVNYMQTISLYNTVLQFAALSNTDHVWDIFCGIGTISLCMAKQAQCVRGNEINPTSVHAARINAVENNIHNVFFEAGAAEKVIGNWCNRYAAPTVAVLDPPRSGCTKTVLETLCAITPQKIIYVSCNPATLARDIAILQHHYTVAAIQPVDMFPHTAHIECVVLFTAIH